MMSVVTPFRSARHPAQCPRGRNIVVVASGKGGVGKTWLAVTLAHGSAMAGLRTLLFDGDLGLANVDLQLGLMPKFDLGAVLNGNIDLAGAITRCEAGFDVIAGKSGSASLAALDKTALAGLQNDILNLAGRYDRLIIDLAAGIDQSVRGLASIGETILVVATDEPTALTDAYAFIKLATADGGGNNVRVVVNMATNPREGERTFAKLTRACQNFLGLSPVLAGIIRRDDKVRDSIRHQSPILLRHPNADASADVQAIMCSLDAPAEVRA
jgi:flagellar biosynthesis protein FlhG